MERDSGFCAQLIPALSPEREAVLGWLCTGAWTYVGDRLGSISIQEGNKDRDNGVGRGKGDGSQVMLCKHEDLPEFRFLAPPFEKVGAGAHT